MTGSIIWKCTVLNFIISFLSIVKTKKQKKNKTKTKTVAKTKIKMKMKVKIPGQFRNKPES